MSLDQSFELAKKLCADLKPRLVEIETEQDARLQMINRFLVEVLGWEYADIKTEPHGPNGYTDYLLSIGRQKRAVIEAKRTGHLLLDTVNPELRLYKVGGPALDSAQSGVDQAVKYCLDHGVNYAILTTGIVWIAFLLFPGMGIPYREGKAFVFPDHDAILKNFATFYDLFSKQGVAEKTYGLQFAKAGGLSASEFEPMEVANRTEDFRMLPSSSLANDLDPVFREFFGAMSGDTDREMLIECFVETRESQYADASLDKIVRTISTGILELSPSSDSQLAQEIQTAVETGRGETAVIVGNNGSGKSTFIERFFDTVLDPSVRSQCTLVRINLLEATGDIGSISSWLTSKIKSGLEASMYNRGIPSFDELQGLYWREYHGWRVGLYKPLYDSDKTAFKIKFSEFLNEQIEREPYFYILRLLGNLVRSRKSLPCIVFDNSDQFDEKFQEAVFQYSQSIHTSIPFTFIVMPVTDRSFWRLSKAGPLQTYPSKKFYLPVPPTKAVLEKRVSFLKRKIEESKDARSYLLTKGIHLSVKNIQGFAACLEEVFLNEDFIARRISWLANNNLRKSLELAQRLILSPFFSIDDLVKTYIASGSNVPIGMNYRKFMQALLLGNYNAFQQDHSAEILNVFTVLPHLPTTPLLKLSILKLLIDRAGEQPGAGSYVSLEQVRQYFDAMGIAEAPLDQAVGCLLSYRLIEPYDASDESIDGSQRVAITHSGRMHYEMATTDPFFISNMAYATPIRSLSLVDTLRTLRTHKMGGAEWQQAQKAFVTYCHDQDATLSRIPKDGIFEGQRQLRADLFKRWIDAGSGTSSTPDESETALQVQQGFSHISATVKWYDPNKGYGFSEAGLHEDVFIHKNILQQAELPPLGQGDILDCDVAIGHRGRFQVIAIHSVQKYQPKEPVQQSELLCVEGAVEFFNPKKGYGFIKTATLPEDVYISVKVLEQLGITTIDSGTKVKAYIEPARIGKGFMATRIEIIH